MKFFLSFVLSFAIASSLCGQSSDTNSVNRQFKSFGIQISVVSGMGLSFGVNEIGKYRARITGGYLSISDNNYYSYGAEYQFELTKNPAFRVFMGPVIGNQGKTTDKNPHWRLGLGTGIEMPVTGNSVIENVTFGGTLVYPTLYFLSGDINIASNVFISYNF